MNRPALQLCSPHTVRAWLQLFRFPNLFTVPGEPLVGYVLSNPEGASGWRVAVAVGAALSFYMAGLAWNDVFDVREDRRDRPQRPLPSGAISVATATRVAQALTVFGLLGCGLLGLPAVGVGTVLAVLVYAYNRVRTVSPVVGLVCLGSCRALSVGLGMTAAQHPGAGAWWVLAITFAYIVAVSALACHETGGPEKQPVRRWGPFAVLLLATIGWGGYWSSFPPRGPLWVFIVLALVPLLTAFHAGLLWGRIQPAEKAVPVRAGVIGRLIGAVPLLHAAWIALPAPGGVSHAVIIGLAVCWWLNRFFAIRFYAS